MVRNFGIIPFISPISDLDEIQMSLWTFRFESGCWNELTLLGMLEWNTYILHVRRTWILKSQRQSTMNWIFLPPQIFNVEMGFREVIEFRLSHEGEIFRMRLVFVWEKGDRFLSLVHALSLFLSPCTFTPGKAHVSTQARAVLCNLNEDPYQVLNLPASG